MCVSHWDTLFYYGGIFMKKILTLLLLVACLFCACTPQTQNITPSPTPNNTPTPELVGCYTPSPSPDNTKFTNMFVTGSNVNVRKEPSTKGEILASLPLNTEVKAYYEENGWYYICYKDNSFGFISASYLAIDPKPTPTPTREQVINYTDLPRQPADADSAGTTYEMYQYIEYKTTLAKIKIHQLQLKIKAKDSKIGAKVDALVAEWNGFVPNNTNYYYDLIQEFEAEYLGSLFNLSRVDSILSDYENLLALLENIYLMMLNYEGYIDKDADGFHGSIEDCKNEHTKNEYSINTINNNLVYEKNNNTKYAKQAAKILVWEQTWSPAIEGFWELKWEILSELDFSKNEKSFELYKAYDKYRNYKEHEYLFKDIDLIMRGESHFWKG